MTEFDINADWDADGLAGLGDAGADEPFSDDFDGGFGALSEAGFGDTGLDDAGLDSGEPDAGGGYAELAEAGAEGDDANHADLAGDGELESGVDEGIASFDAEFPEFPEFVDQLLDRTFDTIGADPDEDGLWQQAMSDLHEDVNPYVAN